MVNEQKENLICILPLFFKCTSNVAHLIFSILHSDWSPFSGGLILIFSAQDSHWQLKYHYIGRRKRESLIDL